LRRLVNLALIVALVAGGSIGSDREAGEPGETFERFAAEYIEAYFAAHPSQATKYGIHAHDSRLRDMSRPSIRRRTRELAGWLERLERIDAGQLEQDARLDYRVLDHAIRAELLELEHVRGWQHDPMLYNRLMTDGSASLVDRQFAPLAQRLTDLIARLRQYPAMIQSARKNLRDVPAAWTELAVKNTRGHVKFLREEVPAALRAQGLDRLEPVLRARWALTRRDVLQELERFAVWLERELLPRSDGNFRLGRELYERKLLYEEHVSMTVDELVETNEQAIREYRQWVARESARLDPERTVEEVMRSVTGQFPSPDDLIPTARRNVEQAREFVRDQRIVTLPTDQLPIIRPTPEYARSGFASMSTPGPFETRATEAYYNITNVDPSWSEEQQQQHLTYFNFPGLLGISIHEAMPGHFVQLLYQRELPTDVRKVFAPASLVEGWAHYTEQMMIDEGLGDGDPAIRLGQLRRALQRHARWYAALALHTGDATIEETAQRFGEIAYFAPFPARRETLRGTYDPTYLVYALGRMQIFELREDYRRYRQSRGETFSIGEFHDRFLRLGLPVSLAREVLIPDAESGQTAVSD
jgi:uncharacterized protein (DUF885 family)